jgi:lipopolysaccharide/colanic/teichoic acid biosynthesis glycosyltransferase
MSWYAAHLKRPLDVAVALAALVVLSPVLLAAVIAVRLVLGPPVCFRQWRAGRDGRPFRMLKLRTMRAQTDESGRPLPDEQRLTRFGRFMRATSLDELPELLHVVRGEMSLVGPRPLPTDYLPRYAPAQARRHEVRPGMTGWAQVCGRNAIGWNEKLALDVWYVDHVGPRLDLIILMRTVGLVLTRRGIAADGHATMPEFFGPGASRGRELGSRSTARPSS